MHSEKLTTELIGSVLGGNPPWSPTRRMRFHPKLPHVVTDFMGNGLVGIAVEYVHPASLRAEPTRDAGWQRMKVRREPRECQCRGLESERPKALQTTKGDPAKPCRGKPLREEGLPIA